MAEAMLHDILYDWLITETGLRRKINCKYGDNYLYYTIDNDGVRINVAFHIENDYVLVRSRDLRGSSKVPQPPDKILPLADPQFINHLLNHLRIVEAWNSPYSEASPTS